MRRFYAPPENFTGRCVSLDLDETRHLRDVLRLHDGDNISVFDGAGREFLCTVETVEKKHTILTILDETSPTSPESHLDLTLAVAILKGEKLELVVQKAVELGVSTLQPLFTQRCDIKPNTKDKKIERWRKIAHEAAKQSGRAKLMKIENPIGLETLPAGSDGENVILFTEREGSHFSEIKPSKKITAIVGPEGGWEDSELAWARERGFTLVTFGGRILRAETAAISVAAILQHRFGDFS